ncbi:hypothetical protein [Kamptonema formosum]|uniref:hypothetical protein n=1 Tax=Kamptonema formosum TaxID=331992 RepID=UPI0012DC2567|nr:hypothetical protein [Oscillatoria sp. PCC 10802]
MVHKSSCKAGWPQIRATRDGIRPAAESRRSLDTLASQVVYQWYTNLPVTAGWPQIRATRDGIRPAAGAHLTHWLPKLCTNGTQIFL